MPKPEHGEDGRHDVSGDAGVTERVDLSDRRFSTREPLGHRSEEHGTAVKSKAEETNADDASVEGSDRPREPTQRNSPPPGRRHVNCGVPKRSER